jgi:hypothetical protein
MALKISSVPQKGCSKNLKLFIFKAHKYNELQFLECLLFPIFDRLLSEPQSFVINVKTCAKHVPTTLEELKSHTQVLR